MSTVYDVVRCLSGIQTCETFVYCVETAKYTAVIAVECEQETVAKGTTGNARHEYARHDKAGKANARHENNASKAVMSSSQMYKFGSLRQLCVKNSDH